MFFVVNCCFGIVFRKYSIFSDHFVFLLANLQRIYFLKMAAETTETDIKTFRDFLMQYNSVTEQCFIACVQDLTNRFVFFTCIPIEIMLIRRTVSEKEERCAKNCLDKFLKMTQRLSMRFQEHQLIQSEAQGASVNR